MRRQGWILGVLWVALLVGGLLTYLFWPQGGWSADELTALRGLWLGSLPPLAADPSNVVAADPRAVTLGHQLFFDTRFSRNGAVSCASCHLPSRHFNDGLPLGQGVGTTTRKTMTVVGTAYSPWFFWDGRKDSQWAQALAPLENPVEHGGTRTQYAHLIDQYYRASYEALFGPLPDLSDQARFPMVAGPVGDPVARQAWERMRPADRQFVTQVYVNLGKAIAAYERQLLPGPSRFDQYVAATLQPNEANARPTLSTDEIAGLKLFIGKAHCINCHNTPLFTDNSFHNTGVPAALGLPQDIGRALGAQQVQADEFNCLSQWSDATPAACAELRFMVRSGEQLNGAFKPSTLRNIAELAPYMHAGQFTTLREVIDHYNRAAPGPVGHSELQPLGLSAREQGQLEAFLGSLSGGVNAPAELLQSPVLPSTCLACHSSLVGGHTPTTATVKQEQ